MSTRKKLYGVLVASLSVAVSVLMLACPAPDDGGMGTPSIDSAMENILQDIGGVERSSELSTIEFTLPDTIGYQVPSGDGGYSIEPGPSYIADDGAFLMSAYSETADSGDSSIQLTYSDSLSGTDSRWMVFSKITPAGIIDFKHDYRNPYVVKIGGVTYSTPPEEETIMVYYSIDPSATDSFTIRIEPPAVHGVTIQKDGKDTGETLSLNRGWSAQVTALVSSHGMHNDHEDRKVTWSSNNPEAVTVSDTGKLEAVGSGAAIITAKSGAAQAEKSDTVTVTVVTP